MLTLSATMDVAELSQALTGLQHTLQAAMKPPPSGPPPSVHLEFRPDEYNPEYPGYNHESVCVAMGRARDPRLPRRRQQRQQPPRFRNVDTPSQTLLVCNLCASISEQDLANHIHRCCGIWPQKIGIHLNADRSRAWSIVQFQNLNEAMDALPAIHRSTLQGQLFAHYCILQ